MRNRKLLIAAGVVAIVAVALIVASPRSRDGAPGQSPAASRCQPASSAVSSAIGSGLESGLSLRNARIVQSNDFEQAHFVSADLQGPGLEGARDIATWVTNRPDGTGSIYSVNPAAEEFSDWGPGGQTDVGFSISDDGARESQGCVT